MSEYVPTNDINWTEPPQRTRPGAPFKYVEFFELLRKHPNRWAMWPTKYKTTSSTSSAATTIRKGFLAGAEPGEFEATARGTDLYIRFTQPKESK